MNNPTPPDDTRADAKTWLIALAALSFCIVGVPAIVETAFQALVP